MVGMNVIRKVIQLKISKIILLSLAIGLAYALWYISNNLDTFQELNVLLGAKIENNFMFLNKFKIHLLVMLMCLRGCLCMMDGEYDILIVDICKAYCVWE